MRPVRGPGGIAPIDDLFRATQAPSPLEDQLQRIGRDLHDGPGQLLTAIRLLSGMVAGSLRDEDHPLAARVENIANLTQQVLVQMRDIYRGLVPAQLQAEGLVTALDELAQRNDHVDGAACTFTHDVACEHWSAEEATHLYRIAQEAVHNALKHGRARRIRIVLRQSARGTALQVEDDGDGFVVEGSSSTGIGLRSMSYRASVLGAKLSVTSRPGHGTSVRCVLPLRRAPRPAAVWGAASGGSV